MEGKKERGTIDGGGGGGIFLILKFEPWTLNTDEPPFVELQKKHYGTLGQYLMIKQKTTNSE